MKKLISCLLVVFSIAAFGQNTEFKEYPTGLMYSDSTMNQLSHIVDSLNLKFRTCDLSKEFLSKGQVKAHYVRLSKGRIKAAQRDMDNGLSFESFIEKYNCDKAVKNAVVVAHEYTSYSDEEMVEFSSLIDGFEVNTTKEYAEQRLGKCTWFYQYRPGSEYSDESITGFYLLGPLESKPIVEEYARLIQYSECMVDTNARIFKENATRSSGWGADNDSKKVEKFLKYIKIETSKPKYNSDNYEQYRKDYDAWESNRFSIISDKLQHTEKFKKLIGEALEDATNNGGSMEEFEAYVEKYVSKKAALELKRGRIVVGQCSMDSSPRRHAKEIAVLSAETVNWETFLRAHLDIMNDYFSRVSDGSYAWAGRKTYIAELEELDIDVPDLMLGISLRLENPSQNHYFGSIGRIGRALAESRYQDEIEERMLAMVEDDRLDEYNRVIMYYLFTSYNHHLTVESRKKSNKERLDKSIQKLPDYLLDRLNKD